MVKSKFRFREKMVRYTKSLRCAIGAFLLLRSKGYVLILSGYQHHVWLYSLIFFAIGGTRFQKHELTKVYSNYFSRVVDTNWYGTSRRSNLRHILMMEIGAQPEIGWLERRLDSLCALPESVIQWLQPGKNRECFLKNQ